jgi:hypothetical protein
MGVGLASAQVCRSDAECSSGTCSIWSCNNTTQPPTYTIIESCGKPLGLLGPNCTEM